MEKKVIDPRFSFVQSDKKIVDAKMETKRIGFLADAMYRFSRNKGSIVAGAILLFMVLFSIITPFCTGYTATQTDSYYTNCLPKAFEDAGGFWDGTEKRTLGEAEYYLYNETGRVREVYSKYRSGDDFSGFTTKYDVRYDTYAIGAVNHTLTQQELDSLLKYDEEVTNDFKVLLPLIDTSWIDSEGQDESIVENAIRNNANYDYRFYARSKLPILKNGELQKAWKVDNEGNYVYYEATGLSGSVYNVRLNYDNYYYYQFGNRPVFGLGSDSAGRDILTRLAVGGRFSLLFAFGVSAINLIIGLVYGSIEGFYGGTVDIVMERITEILSEVPFMVVIALLKNYNGVYFSISVVGMLFIAFVVTGWLGTASTVRMQFYRYKKQEYVLASRTLGASDARLIFRHILPNSIGTIVTSSVLMIPGVIFSESSLSYLGIINFDAVGSTSIGTMLAQGQSSYTTYPNNILWPALFISLLMICFNMFGNGLRDAFNPQLRGSDNV